MANLDCTVLWSAVLLELLVMIGCPSDFVRSMVDTSREPSSFQETERQAYPSLWERAMLAVER